MPRLRPQLPLMFQLPVCRRNLWIRHCEQQTQQPKPELPLQPQAGERQVLRWWELEPLERLLARQATRQFLLR